MKLKIQNIQILNLVAFVAMILANFLANSIPINGLTTGQVVADIPSRLVPAGFTFSIWGLIYLSLGIFVIYQFILLFRKNNSHLFYVEKIGSLFILSSVLNISWLISWHYEVFWLAMVLILSLLITLLAIYRRLRICKDRSSNTVRLIFFLPFSMYFAWIAFASLANISIFFTANKWFDMMFVRSIFGVLSLLVVYFIAISIIVKRRDLVYGIVQLFALFGLLVARIQDGFDSNLLFIGFITFGLFIVGAAIVYELLIIYNDWKYNHIKKV